MNRCTEAIQLSATDFLSIEVLFVWIHYKETRYPLFMVNSMGLDTHRWQLLDFSGFCPRYLKSWISLRSPADIAGKRAQFFSRCHYIVRYAERVVHKNTQEIDFGASSSELPSICRKYIPSRIHRSVKCSHTTMSFRTPCPLHCIPSTFTTRRREHSVI